MNHNSRLSLIGAAALLLSVPTVAQDKDDLATSPLVDNLATCTAIVDDAARLACFDREVGAFVGEAKDGSVKVVEKEDIDKARKKLFGYSVPDAGIFKADSKEEEEANKRLTSTITKVRQVSSKEWHIWIEEGASEHRLLRSRCAKSHRKNGTSGSKKAMLAGASRTLRSASAHPKWAIPSSSSPRQWAPIGSA